MYEGHIQGRCWLFELVKEFLVNFIKVITLKIVSPVLTLTFPFGTTGKSFWTSEPDERSGRALFWCQNSNICFRVGTFD